MKIVITGGPSVGKTTIISLLQTRGYRVVHEIATQVIKEGKILPWADRGKFQAEVLRRQMGAESSILDFDKPVFLDRGAFDGEAYYLYDRMPVPPIFSTIDPSQYDVAFLVEPLAFFDANDVRREDLEFTLEITKIIEQCYRDKRIKVIRVPAMEPDMRVDFVIDSVEKLRATAVRSPEQAASMFRYTSAVVPTAF
ncbi:MAG: AAA family ATPase [Candidatus Obscuribacterales bacterium]